MEISTTPHEQGAFTLIESDARTVGNSLRSSTLNEDNSIRRSRFATVNTYEKEIRFVEFQLRVVPRLFRPFRMK
ncbi:MAG: hypothetical protein RLZZ267_441 [Bacillota bacterium]|jgi:hypothetical protein